MNNNKLNFLGIIPWAISTLLFLIVAIFTGRWLAFTVFIVLAIVGCVVTIFMKKGIGKTMLKAGCITGLTAIFITSLLLSLLGFGVTNSNKNISSSSETSETSSSESTCCDKHSTLCGTQRKDPKDNIMKTWYCCEKCDAYKHSGIVITVSGDNNEVNVQNLVFFGDVKGSSVVNGKHNNAAGATDSALANAGDGVQNTGDENIIDNAPVDIDDNSGDNNSLSGGKENINNAGDNNSNTINSTTKPSTTIPAPATVATTTTSTTKPAPVPVTTTTTSTTKPAPAPVTTTTTSTTKPAPAPVTTTTTTTTKPAPQPEPKPVASVTFQRFDRNGTQYGDVSIYIENPSGDEVIDCGGLGTVRKISDNLYRVEVDLEEGATGSFVITVSGGNLEEAAQFVYAI